MTFGVSSAFGLTYSILDDSVLVGQMQMVSVTYQDSFITLAQRHNVSVVELISANPNTDPWLPGEGTKVLIPNRHILPNVARKGIVINLAELRLYYFPNKNQVLTFPVGIGKDSWETPLATTQVIHKQKDPAWRVPASILAAHRQRGQPIASVVPPGPDNPLGQYALRLDLPGYLIHGTNNPAGVGRRESHGCIRMYPEDIKMLFSQVRIGTPVRIIHAPIKTGLHRDKVYLEVHHPQAEHSTSFVEQHSRAIESLHYHMAERHRYALNWSLIKQMVQYPSGIPLQVQQ